MVGLGRSLDLNTGLCSPVADNIDLCSLLTSLCPPGLHCPRLASLYSSMLPGLTSRLARLVQRR